MAQSNGLWIFHSARFSFESTTFVGLFKGMPMRLPMNQVGLLGGPGGSLYPGYQIQVLVWRPWSHRFVFRWLRGIWGYSMLSRCFASVLITSLVALKRSIMLRWTTQSSLSFALEWTYCTFIDKFLDVDLGSPQRANKQYALFVSLRCGCC